MICRAWQSSERSSEVNDVEETQKPVIRFVGFCSEWTKYEIGNFIEDYTEKTTVQNQYPVLTSSQQQGIVFQEEYFADRQVTTSENIGYYILPFGYFTYRSRSDNSVFVFNRNDLIEKGIISYYYPVFRPNNIDSNFLLRRLNVGTAKQIVKIVEGTGQKVLNHDKFKKLSISVPGEKEREKIGSFFETIDKQISLAQRKYDKLLTFKKSMLEKLFPQNGAKKPEMRFAGFAGEWEPHSLKEIVKEINRNDPTSDAPIMMITASNGFIEQSDRYSFDNAGDSLKKYILLKKGELAYNHGASKLRPYGSCFALTKRDEARIPFVYHCFSTVGNNPEFLSLELNGADVESQLRKIVSSGARMDGLLNISFEEYTSVSILLPKEEEQNKIADFFRAIEELVSLYGTELEKLKNIKSTLLEKMFV